MLAAQIKSELILAARNARRAVLRTRLASTPHGLVLMYHRLATPTADPWGICVSPENFAAHLEVLKAYGPCLKFGDLVRALQDPAPPRHAIAVTFDDGYLDNLVTGLPLLAAAGIPATVFVASGATGSGREFWWDTLTRIFLLTPELPETLRLPMGGRLHEWHLKCQTKTALVLREDRLSILKNIRHILQPLPSQEIETAVVALSIWAGVDRAGVATDHPMDLSELRRLANDGQIEIGSHTVNHRPLTRIHREDAAYEISAGRNELRNRTGRDICSFCYPYGLHDGRIATMVREAGFAGACTVVDGVATTATDPMRLPRLFVRNWSGAEFERQLVSCLGSTPFRSVEI